ncbi:MAG: methyltransferase domain-containing protein [Myxococcales bacterium]|nr:methyltransferase domain-containing protein [Myxococcales bacterium]
MLGRLGRLGPSSLLALALGCTPAAEGPTPTPPPSEPEVVIDEAGLARAADPDGAEDPAGGPKAAAAPEAVPQQINQRYAEQTDPGHWAGRFEREGREVFDHREAILDALGVRPGMRVADVGAGTGLFTMALARAVGERGRVYAVDVQDYFLEHIERRAQQAGLRNVQVVRAQQDAAGLPAGSVELVLMCDAYHHVEQPAAYLASLHAALAPGGRLAIVDYRAIAGQSDAWLLEHVRATPEQFRAEIEAAGFRFLRAHEGLLEENFFYEFERP